jgi:hypothetical protein
MEDNVPALHPTLLTDARAVVTDPARFAAHPTLRLLAWRALMAERGYRVNQLRLTRLQQAAEGAA